MQKLRFMIHVKTYFKPLNFAGFPIFCTHFASSMSSPPFLLGQDGVMGQIEIPNKDVDDFIILRRSVLVSSDMLAGHVVLMG